MLSMRSFIPFALTATIGATSCGSGGEGPSRPSDPTVTVRFLGPNGGPLSPTQIWLDDPSAPIGHPRQWDMHPWPDGTCTDLGGVQLVSGQKYSVLLGSSAPGVFAATTITFTAPDGPIDLGTFDLGLHGASLTSPADGATLTAYPFDFTWTPYPNPAATYQADIWSYNNAAGVLGPESLATSYPLTATQAAHLGAGRAMWNVYVRFVTPEGYEVLHATPSVSFTVVP